jgi:hypothetical protein
MTMLDNKCDVCHLRVPIGVASTSIPLSVAYCVECAQAGADPESVFLFWEEEGHKPSDLRPGFKTWKDGKFISYRRWWNERNETNA